MQPEIQAAIFSIVGTSALWAIGFFASRSKGSNGKIKHNGCVSDEDCLKRWNELRLENGKQHSDLYEKIEAVNLISKTTLVDVGWIKKAIEQGKK